MHKSLLFINKRVGCSQLVVIVSIWILMHECLVGALAFCSLGCILSRPARADGNSNSLKDSHIACI